MELMKLTLDESNIASIFTTRIKERWNILFNQNRFADLTGVLFKCTAIFLKYKRNKANPKTALKLVNENGTFYFGAILEYHAPGDDAEDAGNWTLSWTLDEEDLKDITDIYDSQDSMWFDICAHELYQLMYAELRDNRGIAAIFETVIDSIREMLDSASNGGSEVNVEHTGIFDATVGFEEGTKVFAITPGYEVKQLVKDDKSLSSNKSESKMKAAKTNPKEEAAEDEQLELAAAAFFQANPEMLYRMPNAAHSNYYSGNGMYGQDLNPEPAFLNENPFFRSVTR